MTSIQTRFLCFVESIAVCFLSLIGTSGHLMADAIYIKPRGEEYWGRLLKMTNDEIRFQVDCTGTILELKWDKYITVNFSSGCRPVELEGWGNPPPDCKAIKRKRPFRLFEVLSRTTEDYLFTFDYDDRFGVLVPDEPTNQISESELRKGRYRIFMVCDEK